MMVDMHVARDSVLLIDDDQFIAGSLKQYLLRQWDVDVARDVPAANALMRTRRYRVVVIDPFLTGTVRQERDALMHTARQLQPEAAMIVVTGYGSTEMERTAASCDASLLSKPQSVLALSDAITRASRRTPAVRA
jgi:DNA-binding NtrC family response regulator